MLTVNCILAKINFKVIIVANKIDLLQKYEEENKIEGADKRIKIMDNLEQLKNTVNAKYPDSVSIISISALNFADTEKTIYEISKKILNK